MDMTSAAITFTPAFAQLRTGTWRTLAWAIAASLALHVALLAITMGARGTSGSARDAVLPLRAVITVPDITASLEALPLAAPLTLPPLRREALASLMVPEIAAAPAQVSRVLPETPATPIPAPASPPSRSASAGATGVGKATAVPLRDRARLGPLYDRGITEFPVEISRAPRLDGAVVARYPPAALTAGREDSVVAWVVVNEQGQASEIEFPEGTDEFIEEVRAALRAARFKPAEDGLRPIRFPLALQFDFRLSGGDGATVQAK